MARRGTPTDPDRPNKIVAAAVRILREEGVGAVTHRTVADRARVPLGATTYYFKSISDLLGRSLDVVIAEFETRTNAWCDTHRFDDPGEGILALLSYEQNESGDRVLVSDFELFHAASQRPGLRHYAVRWSDATVNVFSRIVPRSAAVSVNGLVESYYLRATIEGREVTAEEKELIARHVAAIVAVEVDLDQDRQRRRTDTSV